MVSRRDEINALYQNIRASYYKDLVIPNFNPDDYISVEHFLKIISVMYIKNDRHFNVYKPLYYFEVPLGRINSHNQGYLYIPRTDYYISLTKCYRFIECAHKAIIQMSLKGVKDYVIDLRCNSGGLILLFVACMYPFIKSRGVIGTGIDSNGKPKYKYILEDNEFKVENESICFASLTAQARQPTGKSNYDVNEEGIINANFTIQPDEHTRQHKSIIVNDYIPEDQNYDGMSICYPMVPVQNITVLVDHGSGSASEYITSILKAEGAKICGYKTIGILTQNTSFKHGNTTVILPTCLFKNTKGEVYPDGITPDIEGIPDIYLPF